MHELTLVFKTITHHLEGRVAVWNQRFFFVPECSLPFLESVEKENDYPQTSRFAFGRVLGNTVNFTFSVGRRKKRNTIFYYSI